MRLAGLKLITALLCGTGVTTWLPAGSTAAPPSARSWKLVWHDEFSGRAGTPPSRANWLYDTGTGYGCGGCPSNWGTGEVETMTKSTANVYLDGIGHLAIKPVRDPSGAWTSGRIETRRSNFAPPAGGTLAVQASIRLPDVTGLRALGYWPAFWMVGSAFRGNYLNWPGVGEVDVLENVNGLNKDFGTLHCGTSSGGACHETNGLGGSAACRPASCQSTFHTYRVEIDRGSSPEQIRWYLDGKQFWQVSSTQVGKRAWASALHHAFFVILDVAMGGSFPDNVPQPYHDTPTSDTASGAPMFVDYVRVYARSKDRQP